MGEEGSHYFKNAYENGFLNQLLYFDPRAGYYNLIANLSLLKLLNNAVKLFGEIKPVDILPPDSVFW